MRPIDGPAEALADLSRDDLIARVLEAPHRYVGQERLPLSQVPTWTRGGRSGGRMRPRPVTLRTFTLRYGSSYRPLVGGLAAVHGEPGARSLSSKDVWVLKSGPGDADQGLSEVMSLTSSRSVAVTVPRILEDMYWSGRYAERAEDLLRLVLATHTVAEDYKTRPGTTGAVSLQVLLAAIARLAGRAHDDVDEEFRSLLLDAERVGGVAHALDRLREALAGVRDQLSPDTWRAFGATDRAAEALRTSPYSHQISESAGRTLTGILSLQGVTASMMRDAGWQMIGAGRSLERALQLCHLLRATITERRGMDVDRTVLGRVLEATESAVTHRRRYRGYVRPASVFELLILDTENPRSLAFALGEVRERLAAMPSSTGSTRPERLVADLIEEVAAQDIAALVAIGGVGRPNLERFLERFVGQLDRLSEAIAEVHFTAGPPPRLLASVALVQEGP